MRIRLIFRSRLTSVIEPKPAWNPLGIERFPEVRSENAPVPVTDWSNSSLFESVFLPGGMHWWPIISSTVAHVAVLGAIPVLAPLFLASSHGFAAAGYHVETMRLRVPEAIYYSARANDKPAAQTPAPVKAKAPAPSASGDTGSSVAVKDAPAAHVRRGLELPAAPQIQTPMSAIILQPDFNPAAPRTDVLPPLAFWARQTPEMPKPPRKTFVVPGRREAPAMAPHLDAPPTLAVPNRQPEIADLNIALPAPQTPVNPALPVPNTATVPIREKNNQPNSGALDRQEGDPTNFISVSPNRMPPGQVIDVPRGLRNLPSSGSQDGSANGAAAGAPAAAATTAAATSANRGSGESGGRGGPSGANGVNGSKAGGTGNSGGPAASGGSGSGNTGGTGATARAEVPGGRGGSQNAAPSAGSSGNGGASGSARNGDSAQAQPSAASAADNRPPAPRPAPGVIHIDHPVNGNFDVVITQSSPNGDMPDAAAMLTGNPVYTVYLSVGDRREWLLEYCVPARANAGNSSYQVFVGDSTPIAPPYPISTSIPDDVLNAAHPKDIIFHGFLNTSGAFRDLVARDAGNAMARQIAPLLSQWRFRPPTKDKVPVEIEVVLVVPKGL